MSRPEIARALFQHGRIRRADRAIVFELYKMMVKSSEDLVARRQAVNTFFVTINGALLTATGLIIGSSIDDLFKSLGVIVLGATGVTLALSWRSRIKSFGQLNTGKFEVISRLEATLPVAIYDAEWVALGEGRDPQLYRTFTSREVWPPWTFFGVYGVVIVAMLAHVGWVVGHLLWP